jgi:HK97 gp10 family phage protein
MKLLIFALILAFIGCTSPPTTPPLTAENVVRAFEMAKVPVINVTVAIEDSLLISEQIAKSLAAVDTGEMRDKIEITKYPRYGSQIGTLEAKADHSIFVEYGTVNMDAQPFMTPAAEQGRRLFNKRVRAVLK